MPTYTITGPDGKKYPGIKALTEQDAIQQVQRQIGPPRVGIEGVGASGDPEKGQFSLYGSTPTQQRQAAIQGGLLDLPEEGVRMAENIPGIGPTVRAAIPSGLRSWAENYKREATATPGQRAVRTATNIVNPYTVFPWSKAAGLAVPAIERAAQAAPAVAGAVQGGISGALQPTDGKFSWPEKAAQFVAGAAPTSALSYFGSKAQRLAADIKQWEGRGERFVNSWVRGALDKAGLQHVQTPAIGPTNLGQAQAEIGNRLNAINRQFRFTPAGNQAFTSEAQQIIDRTRSDLIHQNYSLDRWDHAYDAYFTQPMSDPIGVQGQQFSNFIRGLDTEASKQQELARRGPFGAPDSGERYIIARGLRDLADAAETHAVPVNPNVTPAQLAQLRAARASARGGYRDIKIAFDASKASGQGMFTPTHVANEWEAREGDWYRNPKNWTPQKQWLHDQIDIENQPRPGEPSKIRRYGPRALTGAALGGAAGFEVGRHIGAPGTGAYLGSTMGAAIAPGLTRMAQQAARLAPGIVGAAGGRAAGAAVGQDQPDEAAIIRPGQLAPGG